MAAPVARVTEQEVATVAVEAEEAEAAAQDGDVLEVQVGGGASQPGVTRYSPTQQ